MLACRTARFTFQCVRLLQLFSAITVPTCSCALRSLRAAHSGQMTSLLTRVTNGVFEATISRCVLPSVSIARGFHRLSCVCACSRSSRRSSFARHSVYCRHHGLSLPLEVFGVLVCALYDLGEVLSVSSGSASRLRFHIPTGHAACPRGMRRIRIVAAAVSPGFCVRLWN